MSRLFLDTIRAFAAREVEPAAADIDRTGRVPEGLVATMRRMGLLDIGEDGPEPRELLDVVETLARSSASVAMLVVAPAAAGRGSVPERDEAPATTGLRGVREGVTAALGPFAGCEPLLGVAAVGVGVAARAYELTTSYAATRSAFGRALAEFPVLADTMERMARDLALARACLARAVGADDRSVAALAADTAARAAVRAAYSAIQLHGGYGYMAEYGVERLARDAISLRALVAGLSRSETTTFPTS